MAGNFGLYIPATEVQRVLGLTDKDRQKNHLGYKKAIRWMAKGKILLKRAGRLVTTRDLLMTEMPEVWADLAQDATEIRYLSLPSAPT